MTLIAREDISIIQQMEVNFAADLAKLTDERQRAVTKQVGDLFIPFMQSVIVDCVHRLQEVKSAEDFSANFEATMNAVVSMMSSGMVQVLDTLHVPTIFPMQKHHVAQLKEAIGNVIDAAWELREANGPPAAVSGPSFALPEGGSVVVRNSMDTFEDNSVYLMGDGRGGELRLAIATDYIPSKDGTFRLVDGEHFRITYNSLRKAGQTEIVKFFDHFLELQTKNPNLRMFVMMCEHCTEPHGFLVARLPDNYDQDHPAPPDISSIVPTHTASGRLN